MENNNKHKVVCFGEVLWDILPTGSVPGGASMNVAYHLHKQQKNPALITSIGIDEKGEDLIKIFSDYGVCTDFFQVDYEHETGKVFAEPNERNEVVYDIVKPVAWDFIKWEDDYEDLVSNATYFVFGSLASRNQESKKTLFQLLEIAENKVLDINLRPPHFNRRIVEELLNKADFLKLNLAELELITGWFSKHTNIQDRVTSLTDKFKIQNIVVTMGGDGAIMYYNGHEYLHKGYKVDVVDTVGSGDAFLAGLISKLLDNASPADTLEFASGLGAFIATQKGACPDYEVEKIYELLKAQVFK
ncbi:MAG: carbohydrate kinase [Ferruginibacter sp.]